MLKQLTLAFIEDWWYEISSLISDDNETFKNLTDYVKKMINEEKSDFEWLKVKIQLIQYFKEIKTPQQNSQEEIKTD